MLGITCLIEYYYLSLHSDSTKILECRNERMCWTYTASYTWQMHSLKMPKYLPYVLALLGEFQVVLVHIKLVYMLITQSLDNSAFIFFNSLNWNNDNNRTWPNTSDSFCPNLLENLCNFQEFISMTASRYQVHI